MKENKTQVSLVLTDEIIMNTKIFLATSKEFKNRSELIEALLKQFLEENM